ncbi:hypothetical protein CN319_22150, partial [Bacillus cereus]
DTDRIRIEIGETEGVFKVESVELICMEQMEDRMYDMAGNVEEEMQYLQESGSVRNTSGPDCNTIPDFLGGPCPSP